MKKILTALCLLVLFGWMGAAVENSSAQPLGHAHKNIFSQSNEHKHSDENTERGNFYCPMHKHSSLMPCPHKHSQKEMAHPRQCKIGPDCGRSPFQSVPAISGFDRNSALLTDMSRPDLPRLVRAISPLWLAYEALSLDPQKHPPKSL